MQVSVLSVAGCKFPAVFWGELIRPSVLGEPLVDSMQEPMPVEKRLEYVIQVTASVWEPLEQVHYVVSDDVDFDFFGMTPWDAGGTPVGCQWPAS